ncbi:hypothetical protein Ahy_A07g034957 isoform B [Arachis hypogaea]|uniref:Mitochondrial carrier protein n=1 Tax=Arachis hypogaea TaxID=3818 RepID=A0A445CDG8_ARAHY|nr:hypothetical protein Ahy_A07g034957 isoform B [Arachis hypogaea]
MPCYDIFRNFMEEFTTQNAPNLTPYVPLVAGSVARSLACVSCYPVELARTCMQAFKATGSGKPPGIFKTLIGAINPIRGTERLQSCKCSSGIFLSFNSELIRFTYIDTVIGGTGLGAQLFRDVPYSGICWLTLEPAKTGLCLGQAGPTGPSIWPAKTGFWLNKVRQTGPSVWPARGRVWPGQASSKVRLGRLTLVPCQPGQTSTQKDRERTLQMTTRTTLIEIWRDGGLRGLFTGVGPRVGRSGPSVGIVVSFYEVVKHALHHRQKTSS